MSLGLSHSLSRYKLKFSPDKVHHHLFDHRDPVLFQGTFPVAELYAVPVEVMHGAASSFALVLCVCVS